MMVRQSLLEKSVVLVGAGNAHLTVLRKWGMGALPGVSLTLVSESSVSLYSAMIPLYLAGEAKREEIEIDVARSAAAWGVRFLADRMVGLDREKRLVFLASHPPLRYDFLSLNIGSHPSLPQKIDAPDLVIPLRPLDRFASEIEACMTKGARVAIVGGGATGTELALALRKRYGATIIVIEARAFTEFQTSLSAAGIEVRLGLKAVGVERGGTRLENGSLVVCDRVIFATNATPAPVLSALNLATDSKGFLRVLDTLRSFDDERIFAAGDCAGIASLPDLAKNGVYAVQQGRLLWGNLAHALKGERLEPFKPGRYPLSLVDTADGKAVFSYGNLRFTSAWALRLKRRIDRAWRDGFLPRDMAVETEPPRCGGCGSKLPGDVLKRVLERLEIPSGPQLLLGCKDGEDAAVARPPQGRVEVQTVDFFRSFVNDPFLFGQLAANHAVSDLHAMNANPSSALAIVTLPYARASIQESLLEDMMRGALDSFAKMGVALAGGHTTEGAELALGFSVTGYADERALFRKNRLEPGDRLLLTKRLGTGALLAARMRGKCRSDWFDRMAAELLISNARAVSIFERYGVVASTDVTGFGLAGHLLEMLDASGVSARLWFTEVKLYDGFDEVTGAGVWSTLQPENARLKGRFIGDEIPEWLFDPQTCGGLLAGVKPDQAERLLEELKVAGYPDAALIGEVTASEAVPKVFLGESSLPARPFDRAGHEAQITES